MSKWHTTEFCETCAKEFCCTSECKYHLLHRIKEAREEIQKLRGCSCSCSDGIIDDVEDILDELIESEDKE